MANSSSTLAIAAAGLAVIALGMSVNAFVRSKPDDSPVASAETDARIADLEKQVRRLSARREPASDTPRSRVDGDTEQSAVDVTSRLAALEETVADLEETLDETEERVDALAESSSSGPSSVLQAANPTPEQVDELRALALNEDEESRPRLLAVRALARVDGGRTLEVARAMRKLFHESEDEWSRTAAVALLEGFVDPEIEPWIVETLLNDRYSSTRESATDVLAHYTGSQRVRDALTDAAANDKNYDVRADAQNALDKIDEREDLGE